MGAVADGPSSGRGVLAISWMAVPKALRSERALAGRRSPSWPMGRRWSGTCVVRCAAVSHEIRWSLSGRKWLGPAQCFADTARHSGGARSESQARSARVSSSDGGYRGGWLAGLLRRLRVADRGRQVDPRQGSRVYYSDVVGSLPPNARVLDCACGTGQLAVGLASLGLDVVAADASSGMVRRTEKAADEQGVALRALRASWDELPDHLEDSTFDLVCCVGICSGTLRAQPGA